MPFGAEKCLRDIAAVGSCLAQIRAGPLSGGGCGNRCGSWKGSRCGIWGRLANRASEMDCNMRPNIARRLPSVASLPSRFLMNDYEITICKLLKLGKIWRWKLNVSTTLPNEL